MVFVSNRVIETARSGSEIMGPPQVFNIEEMIVPLLAPEEHALAVILGCGRRERAGSWGRLRELFGGELVMSGSCVQEVYPRPSEAERVLPKILNPKLVGAVRRAYFGAQVDVRKCPSSEYVGLRLPTYILPPNIDIRTKRTEWSEGDFEEAVNILQTNTAILGDQWWVSRIDHPSGMRQLQVANPRLACSGINFYFKKREQRGSGLLTAAQHATASNARELQRQVALEVDERGKLIGVSPGLLGRKERIWNQLTFVDQGEWYERLGRGMREAPMTGRVSSSLDVSSYGNRESLAPSWRLNQWLAYVGNMMLSYVQDPTETVEMMRMAQILPPQLDNGPMSREEVVGLLKNGQLELCDDRWRKMLTQIDTMLLGQEPNTSGLCLADLSPLLETFSPMNYEKVMTLVAPPDERELITRLT